MVANEPEQIWYNPLYQNTFGAVSAEGEGKQRVCIYKRLKASNGFVYTNTFSLALNLLGFLLIPRPFSTLKISFLALEMVVALLEFNQNKKSRLLVSSFLLNYIESLQKFRNTHFRKFS